MGIGALSPGRVSVPVEAYRSQVLDVPPSVQLVRGSVATARGVLGAVVAAGRRVTGSGRAWLTVTWKLAPGRPRTSNARITSSRALGRGMCRSNAYIVVLPFF